MTPGWDVAADSPLLELDDGRRRARFAVAAGSPAPAPEQSGVLAGAVDVDLTPPPGLPKAGYSANAHDGDGFRTRLHARVLHLRAGAASVALVQCDLLGGSAVLQRLVARAVADRTDVPLHGLFIGATHTHAGPGQFLGTDFYNRFASNRSGFDPVWTQFLVERIAGGVEEAVERRRPARLASGSAEVWGLTRNRSLRAHVANADVGDRRTASQRRFAAIDPRVHVLRVDAAAPDGGFEPLAAAVVFAVHGTGVSMRAEEYNADLWAYLVGEMARRIERTHGVRPVVGAMQGTHADIAPAIRPGLAGHPEAQRIGRRVGARAAELYEGLGERLTDHVELGAALREVDLNADRRIDGVELPNRPAVGAALVAGAAENVTPVINRLPPFRADFPKPARPGDPQGAKWVIGSRWLQPIVLPRRGFPRVLPLHILRIGELAVVGLPFEITLETGRRIEAAAAAALSGAGVTQVAVSSVANEYSGYVATAEEYSRQFYEGGHTLYGPQTERFLTAHVRRLAQDLATRRSVADTLHERRFDLHVRRFWPRPEGGAVERASLAPARYVDVTATEDAYWEWTWRDVDPARLRWHEPLASVEARDDGDGGFACAERDGRLIDDGGWDLSVTHLGPDAGGIGHRYRVRWHEPDLRAGRAHRFVLAPNGGQPELASAPFD